jgi:lactoylglutathione lyase
VRRWPLIAAPIIFAGLPASVDAKIENQPVAAMDHVAISVADADKSAVFYQALFGFKQVHAPFPTARWLVMGNGVMLHIVGNRSAPSAHSRWDHLALACADINAFIANLDAHHILWSNMDGGHTPQVRGDGVEQIFIQDPDGYWIEINDALKRKK